jgi:sugar (pentulose or hexulose) kinase
MSYLLGFDVGQTALKATLLDLEESKHFKYEEEITDVVQEGLIFEASPVAFWEACQCAIRYFLKEKNIRPDKIRAISFACQGEAIFPADED